jgi:flagellar hook-length control protein FliK
MKIASTELQDVPATVSDDTAESSKTDLSEMFSAMFLQLNAPITDVTQLQQSDPAISTDTAAASRSANTAQSNQILKSTNDNLPTVTNLSAQFETTNVNTKTADYLNSLITESSQATPLLSPNQVIQANLTNISKGLEQSLTDVDVTKNNNNQTDSVIPSAITVQLLKKETNKLDQPNVDLSFNRSNQVTEASSETSLLSLKQAPVNSKNITLLSNNISLPDAKNSEINDMAIRARQGTIPNSALPITAMSAGLIKKDKLINAIDDLTSLNPATINTETETVPLKLSTLFASFANIISFQASHLSQAAAAPSQGVYTPQLAAPALDALGNVEAPVKLTQAASDVLKNQVYDAKINLHPADLGHIVANLRIEKNSAELQILTQSQHIKEIVESNLPNLRESFHKADIQLTTIDVQSSLQGQYQQSQQFKQQQGRPNPLFNDANPLNAKDSSLSNAQPQVASNALIDTYL